MTAFVSQRPNTDPEPWVDPWGDRQRYACDCGATCHNPTEHSGAATFAPRPKYTQTRDTHPYEIRGDNNTWRGTREEAERILANPALYSPRFRVKWDPRHDEFDPPVNPILAAYRSEPDFDLWDIGFAMFTTYGGEKSWEQPGHGFHCFVVASPTEIDRARRVLLKFAAVYS